MTDILMHSTKWHSFWGGPYEKVVLINSLQQAIVFFPKSLTSIVKQQRGQFKWEKGLKNIPEKVVDPDDILLTCVLGIDSYSCTRLYPDITSVLLHPAVILCYTLTLIQHWGKIQTKQKQDILHIRAVVKWSSLFNMPHVWAKDAQLLLGLMQHANEMTHRIWSWV